MITRSIQEKIEQKLFRGKAIVVVGARQVGKTTLFNEILRKHTEKTLRLNLDEADARELLTNPTMAELQQLVADNQILMIDEAQRAADIGLTLKRIQDNFPQVQLMVTGSSSLDLRASINEPMTGRKWEYQLFPLSTAEILNTNGILTVRQTLESRLVYGSYPDVLNYQAEARETLTNLTSSYLYKDLLELEGIRKPALLEKLLVALALQMGSEVSYNELAQTIGSDSKTIEKYIDLLEKCFIIFRLQAFSRNLRNELKKSRKIYFYDNGVRNAVISNFSQIENRTDAGALFENYAVSECMKYKAYTPWYANSWFWRTTAMQEIDYIEEKDGQIHAYEFKWNPSRKATAPLSFRNAYPTARFSVINRDNIEDLLLFRPS